MEPGIGATMQRQKQRLSATTQAASLLYVWNIALAAEQPALLSNLMMTADA